MFNPEIAKFAVNVVAGIGVSKVVRDVIKNNVDIVTKTDAVKVAVGSLVIGTMIADHVSNHINDRFDSAVAWYKKEIVQEEENKTTVEE